MRRWLVLLVVAGLVAACTSPAKPAPVKPPHPSAAALSGPGLWIGGFTDGDASRWKSENERIAQGKMRVRRSFDSTIPTSWAASAAGKDAASGIISFPSIRPPDLPTGGQDIQGVIDGKYDSAITNWAKGAPRTGPVFATMSHEPEAPDKQLGGGLFVRGFRHFYKLVKAANPNIQLAPIYMAYQWRPGSITTAHPDDWWVGSEYCDFIGVDDYNQATTDQRTTVVNDRNFQRWYNWAKYKGKPLAVTEYGRMEDPDDPNALPRELKTAEKWLLQHYFVMWLFWDGAGANADWTIRSATIKPWTKIASHSRLR